MTVTAELSAFVAGLQIEALPPEVVARTRLLVLDLVGNAVRARQDAESTPALLAAVRALGMARGEARVFADTEGYSPAGAALVNATLGHSLDFDDTHAEAVLHPGAPVIPAALAAAEMVGASGAEVMAGIVAGYEVGLRLALALPAGAHYDRGFHPSATCGAFGAAAAAARVMRLDADTVASALGIALSQCAGSLQFLANGAWTKRFQVGWAGMAGLTAATLAREGFKGAAEAVEGKHGFLNAYAPAPRAERVLWDLGEVYELMATGVKPYPSCRWGHAGIDAALALREELGLRAEEIESATLGLSRAGLLLVGEPAARKADPRNVVDAQFSGPFVIACALATGRMDWDSYRLLDDAGIRGLLPRIGCAHDDEIEAEFPMNMAGKLTLRARGQTFVRTVVVPKGEPANFPDEAELRAKFAGLADAVLGAGPAAALAEEVLRLDRLNDAAGLLRRSAPAGGRSEAA
ncbi:MmgE/PrpD family protein [Roseomonas aerophila]|uniref:MmgE/PrpD family protein n=1 Tax=Teichococcus aerophilus TaxID=1224513 RepID=A0ABR7RK11_9PROT|nr:MmgE/PrpD family protein [Pseudoroseomonas aerophila]MBC9206753.1 MmgE/PrpD family protein [Pseudoroseomonas aerophila]